MIELIETMNPIRLIEKRWGDNEYSILDVTIEKKKITFSGVDGGDSVKEYWGDFDYEYWRVIKSSQYQKLLGALIAESFKRGVFKMDSEFASWCDENGIETSFQSYV